MMNASAQRTGFASYRITMANADGSWTISAPDAPDLLMSISDEGYLTFSILRWEFKRPNMYSLSADAEMVHEETIVFKAAIDMDGMPAPAFARGQALLQGCQDQVLSKASWGRGNEDEADAVIGAVALLTGLQLQFTTGSGSVDEGRSRLKTWVGGPWRPAILDDIPAYYKVESRSGTWGFHSNAPICRRIRGPLHKRYRADRDGITAHERLQAIRAIEEFYEKAGPVLGLGPVTIAERSAEVTTRAFR